MESGNQSVSYKRGGKEMSNEVIYPCHAANVWLDGEYDWLISLGYEMSDDERQLRDGTHEVFKAEGKE